MAVGTLVCIVAAFLCTWIAPVIFGVVTGKGTKGYITAVMGGVLAGLMAGLIAQRLTFDTTGIVGILLTAVCTAVLFTATRAVVLKLCGMVGDSVLLGYGIGIGQGMMAHFIAVGMLYLNNTVFGTMMFVGSLDGVLANAGMSAQQAQAMKDTLANTPAYMYLMSGFEQFLTVIVMVLCSFIIAYFAKQNKFALGCVLSFAAEAVYRVVMLSLAAFGSEAVQYMTVSLLVLAGLFLIYMSLLAALKISLPQDSKSKSKKQKAKKAKA